MNINEKLSIIQTKFKAKKSRYNSFGKYNFRSAEYILEAIKPYLLEHKVTVTIKEKLVVSEPIPVIQTIATITDGKESISATAIVGVDLLQKGMQTPQQFGSASSYAKKYALGNLLLIDDTKDSDATNKHDGSFDVDAAKKYIQSGGTLEAIKKKYKLSPELEKELTL